MKNVGYDDDDYYDEDGYESPDPEEQEFLKQCTAAVSQHLRAGQPSVTATTEEIQEALWHYYNDVEKSTSYLRGTFRRNLHGRNCFPGRGCVVLIGDLELTFVLRVSGKKEKELKKQQAAPVPKNNGKQRDHMHLFVDLQWLGLGKLSCVPAVASTLGEIPQRCVIRFFINPALYNQSRMT